MSAHPPEIPCWGYRIIEFKGGKMYTLFHGNNGSRLLKPGEWMQADIDKGVRDGGHNYYKAGWHVIPSMENCEACIRNFRKPRDLRVIEAWHETNYRFKPTNANVILTEWLFIHEAEYEKLCRGG